MARPTRRERCQAGRHTPMRCADAVEATVRRARCRYCGMPIMRTHATRIWFAAGLMAGTEGAKMSNP